MELVGIADVAPTLSVRALVEKGMPYAFYNASSGNEQALAEAGVPVSGSFEDLVSQVDIMLDAAPGGIGAKNKELYARMGRKGHFPGRREEQRPMCFSTAMQTMPPESAGTI